MRERTRDPEARRQHILRAAARVFIRKGFQAARMQTIAREVGIGVGTLYHYFRSKDHMFASILEESTRILGDRLRHAAAKRLPPALGLLAIARAYVDYFAENPDFFRIQMNFRYRATTRGQLAKDRERIEALAREDLQLFADKIEEGQEAGVFRKDVAPFAAATALWASYNGILSVATNRGLMEITGLSVERLLRASAFLHFSGLSADPDLVPATLSEEAEHHTSGSAANVQEAMGSVPWIDPATIFSGMKMTFQPDKARGVRETFRFELEGDRGGVWTVRVDDGRMDVARNGDSGVEATVTIRIADRRFIELVTGSINPVELLVNGEMQVQGDLQKAARFQSFFVPG